jgi:hypothetical protein
MRTTSTGKASAKRPAIKTTATKSKYSGKKDRFTFEQRRRINEYKESLKTLNVKPLSAKKHRNEPSRYAAQPASDSDLRVPESATKNVQFVTDARRASKDPPITPSARLSSGSNEMNKRLSAARSENKERRDPPTEDPPTEGKAEVVEHKSPTNVTTDAEETAGATFSEALYSQWSLLRRGLQALGLVSANDADTEIPGDVVNEKFYDALEEHSQVQKKYLVEDVSDEDEEICELRRASLNNTPNRGDPWMHPVAIPRFTKPDP